MFIIYSTLECNSLEDEGLRRVDIYHQSNLSTMPSKFPDSVTQLLKSTRYVHLATSKDNFPHVTLMNYTYYHKASADEDYIIITTPKDTTKYDNIVTNPNVSLLVHDWISARAPEASKESNGRRNSLFELLTNLNRTEISRVSVMLTGTARVLEDHDSEEYQLYRSLHLNNNSIDEAQAKTYISGESNVLVLIRIDKVKVTDTEDNVTEY